MIELPQEARRDPFPKPWERFRQELEARLDPIDPRHQIDLLKLETYESDEEIKPVFVSRMPNHKVTARPTRRPSAAARAAMASP